MYMLHERYQLLIVFCLVSLTMGGLDQRRLLKYLVLDKQYNSLERPVQNDSKTLPVYMNLALQQIIDFDGKNQIIIVSGWMVLTWHDYTLRWDPKEYGNIETIRIPSTQIWTPDIILYSSADEKFDSTIKVNVVVHYTGDILYVPPGMFRSICPFNIASFPFDTQTCTLKFGSWTYDESGINLTAESRKGQLDAYIKNTQWDLIEFSVMNNALKYDCCPTLYPFVLFTIRIRRRSLYYVTNVVVPCFLISCMTLLGFLLAPDSGEKLTLQITTLLSVVTFSLLISDIMPPSSTAVPIITIYFLFVMCMCAISVSASVLVISLHFRDARTSPMPLWVKKYISHHLAWLLGMKRPEYDLTWCNNIRHHSNLDKPHIQLNDPPKIMVNPVATLKHSSETNILCSKLHTIVSQLQIITNHIWKEEKYDSQSQDWKFIAMVIDRLCLITFLIIITIFTILILLSTFNLYHIR